MVTADGREISRSNEISEELTHFYKNLYSTRGVDQDLQQTFLEAGVNKLEDEDQVICDQELTMDELGEALQSLPNNKTPGSDGFNADFYKFWWPHIKELVLDSFTSALRSGHLSIDQRRGVITLLPKKSKDTRFLKNWRPISLLNTDYKILTKLLAIRVQRVIPYIINPDQVGYIKGRYIGQNIRTIIDMIQYTKTTQQTGLIAFLDFEKAFDSIEWSFIEKAMYAVGFGETFVNWVRVVYADTSSCVLNNGFTTEYFKLERGIRQGCPLSVYLFIIAVEFLADSIRKDDHIKGIKIVDQEVKVIQMADDTTVFLQDAGDLTNLLQKLYLFSRASGLKLNKAKTEAIWIGANEGSLLKPGGVNWVSEVYALGTWFSIDVDHATDRNFAEKFDKFTRALNMWKPLDLSTKGKITVIKNIAMPILLYATSNLTVPNDFVKNINNVMYSFIWRNGPDKIKRNTLIAKVKNGGLKMVDIESMMKAQKVMWAKRLVSSDMASWKFFPKWCMGDFGTTLLQCQYNPENVPLQLPSFYKQVLEAWGEAMQCQGVVETAWDVRRQSLIFNKNILIGGQYIGERPGFTQWFRKGIRLIHNIVDNKGAFLSIQAIKDLYDIELDIMRYNGLKDAIPGSWRQLLVQMTVAREAISVDEGPYLALGDSVKPLCLKRYIMC